MTKLNYTTKIVEILYGDFSLEERAIIFTHYVGRPADKTPVEWYNECKNEEKR